MKRPSRLLALLGLVLAGTIGMSGVTNAAPKTPSQNGIISSSMDKVTTAASHVWTNAELLAAKPYPVPEIASAEIHAALNATSGPNGPAGSIKGQAPKISTATKAEDLISIESFTVPTGSYRSFPYSAVGKLFFTQNGGNYQCSAAMIKGHGIWTAGHCVHAGNNSASSWSTNVVFIPQYLNGSAPFGQCSVTQLWTTTDWYTNGNPNGLDNDYAAGAITCNVSGSTGWLGLTWNQSYSQSYQALGYPAAPPFTGGVMIGCNSGLASYGFGTPTTYGITCDMTGGSSGGPWQILNGYENGNTSYGDSAHPGMLFSPYYNANVKSMWDLLPA